MILLVTIDIILRILIGTGLLVAAISKIMFRESFEEMLKQLGVTAKLKASIYWVTVSLELLLGAAILLGILTLLFFKLVIMLTILFTLFIVFVLIGKKRLSCGCFGILENSKVTYKTLMRNLVIIAIVIAGYFLESIILQPSLLPLKNQWIPLGMINFNALLLSACISFYFVLRSMLLEQPAMFADAGIKWGKASTVKISVIDSTKSVNISGVS